MTGTLCAAAMVLLALTAQDASAKPAANITVGTQTLALCEEQPIVAYCGRFQVPLDRGVYEKPQIGISYKWYPAAGGEDQTPSGTVVPVEGGPGYATIESVSEGYMPMYGALLKHWNMLAIDNRGTGTSTPIDCPGLQDFSGPTASEDYEESAAECADYLDQRWHGPGGVAIHAQDLFDTADAAADMAQIVQALGVGKIDLYGDSYGSYYAQVFAARYPQMIRSLTLDSTYGGEGEETLPFTDHDELIRHLNAVCERWSACRQREHQKAWATVGELASMLRATPISGTVPGTHGQPTPVSMNVVGLVDLLNDAAGDKVIYGAIDAAARAALKGYDAPLLRLYEQRLVWDEDYFGEPVKDYSVGLYTDVTCTDYAQLYSLQASLPERRAEYQQTIEEAPPGAFAPFTTEEWVDQDQNTNSYPGCLDWPAPTINEPPFPHAGPPNGPPELPSGMKVLVLGGELDIWTPPAEVAAVIEFLGGDSRYIELANATHVVGEEDTPCGDALVREFVARPDRLQSMSDACAAEPPIHAVGVYAATLDEEPPATLVKGAADAKQLRLLAAAVQTAGDGIVRLGNIHGSSDDGLNGGKVTEGEEGVVKYRGDELIPGVLVSGTAALRPAHDEAKGKLVKATLTVTGEGLSAELVAHWTSAGGEEDLADISATIDGRRVTATVPAP